LFGHTPSARFCSGTFWAGVVAPQRPITCPKRQLPPERYAKCHAKYPPKYFIKGLLT